ncbi:CCA tRNA nucleotidyltransferase [Clostridium sp. YIM B02551]|uniref:CCA tRNA nucleotidyltransferase n=1 Tax=Clostridium sp. YIM B02551 TaxID=2910679 RepID=UPI001EEBF4BE|nr:CCA tRNA nucleotidyltransferase [Clostridium sp. YIM B02551]
MFISYPKEVKYIIDKLNDNGFEGFLVGGSVRNSLLSLAPKDFDITTNALPEDVIRIFNKTIPTGLKHGTVTVMENSIPFEVTTYRIDGEYKDNRRPEEVTFVSSLKEDLARRDFTINAFAYNETYGLMDYFNGINDLNSKLIRAVGDADKRFNEDALRMLRAIRFSCQLGFTIEKSTLDAIKKNSELILNISSERIREEFLKIITSPYPTSGLRLLNSTGILKHILPELQSTVDFDQKTPYHNKDVFEHTLSVVKMVPNKVHLRLAALFHDIAKPPCFFIGEDGHGHFYNHQNIGAEMCVSILKRLTFDNDTINKASILVKEHMNILFNPSDAALKRLINRVSIDLVFDLFKLQRADILSSAPPFKVLSDLDYMEKRTKEIIESSEPLSKNSLKVNGKVIMDSLNLKPSKEVGVILDYLMDMVLEDPNLNNKHTLISLATEYYKKRNDNDL